jgi:AcrR family transcriptional regulator
VTPEQGPARRLVLAVWHLWETRGHAAISARLLAQEAGVPISSLYNHFPSLDHVFLQAQQEALDAAQRWCAAQLEQLFTPPAILAQGALAPVLAAVIDEWAQGQRTLAFAWREGFLLARRDARFMPHWQSWRTLWGDFWQRVCDACGLGPFGAWTGFFFEGETALHMLSWRRVLDRACLEEICLGWQAWLGGHLVAEGPWRQRARETALASFPELPIHDALTQHIAGAAADVVEHQGMARLTHRAVAAQAQVSLGMVSSRFRTSLDLVRAAFEAIYQRLAAPQEDPQEPPQDSGATGTLGQIMPGLTGERMKLGDRLAIEELMLTVARQDSFQPFAPQLRYLRGRTSGHVLRVMAGGNVTVSPLDAAIFSDLISGMQRAGISLSPQDKASQGRAHLSHLLALLGLPPLPADI